MKEKEIESQMKHLPTSFNRMNNNNHNGDDDDHKIVKRKWIKFCISPHDRLMYPLSSVYVYDLFDAQYGLQSSLLSYFLCCLSFSAFSFLSFGFFLFLHLPLLKFLVISYF